MSKGWVNLDGLRKAIAEMATEMASKAGIENPRVHVRVDEPDARGRRHITVQVAPLSTEEVEYLQGRPWEDN